MDSQQTAESEVRAPRRSRTRIGHDRSQLVHALEAIARATGAPFSAPKLQHLAEISNEEYRAVCVMISEALEPGVRGITALAAGGP